VNCWDSFVSAVRLKLETSNFVSIYTVSQKTRYPTDANNFAKYYSIFKILLLLDSAQNLLQNDRRLHIPPHLKDIAALHCETVMFQKSHKFKNTVPKKRCFEKKFMWIYLLYILVSPNSPALNPVNYKVWALCSTEFSSQRSRIWTI